LNHLIHSLFWASPYSRLQDEIRSHSSWVPSRLKVETLGWTAETIPIADALGLLFDSHGLYILHSLSTK